jgi:DNA-binding protein YbaB
VISDEAMKLNDKDMLADLFIAATNMALAKAREEVAKASQAMAADAGLPLPPGMLPGM